MTVLFFPVEGVELRMLPYQRLPLSAFVLPKTAPGKRPTSRSNRAIAIIRILANDREIDSPANRDLIMGERN